MHLACALALAFDDIFGPDRDARGNTGRLHGTSLGIDETEQSMAGRGPRFPAATIRPQDSNVVGKLLKSPDGMSGAFGYARSTIINSGSQQ